MKEKISKWEQFKRFLKRNMTKTWAQHFSYQVFAFLVSVAMVVGVGNYAFQKTYDERKLTFMDDFTITAHTGANDTVDNSLEYVEMAVKENFQIVEVDVRCRPDGTLVIAHDIVVTNNDGTELSKVFDLIKPTDIMINLDIKEQRTLKTLRDLVVEYGMMGQVFMTGIEQNDINAVKANCPDITYYLNYKPSRFKIFSEDYQEKIVALMDETGAVGINCNYKYASRTLSGVLHKNGYKLSIWTADDKRWMKRALVCKPNNITTHYPAKLQDVIDNWGE